MKFIDEVGEHLCSLDVIMGKMVNATAEELLLEQEKRRLIIDVAKEVISLRKNNGKPAFTRKDRKVLWLYIVKRSSFRAIEDKTGISNKTLAKTIDSYSKRIQRYMADTEKYNELKDTLLSENSQKEIGYPQHKLGWLLTTLHKSGVKGKWGIIRGKRTWKSQWKCMVPEELQRSFKRNDVKCCYCNAKCTRKTANVNSYTIGKQSTPLSN